MKTERKRIVKSASYFHLVTGCFVFLGPALLLMQLAGGPGPQAPADGAYYLEGMTGEGATWTGAYLWDEAFLWDDAVLWDQAFLRGDAHLWGDAFLWGDVHVLPVSINNWVEPE